MPDIVITPNRGTTNNPKIDFTGTSAGTIKLEVLGDGTIAWNGANGSLFSIADSLSGSLMSVNDISGLPAFEVFSDNRVVVGQFGANLLLGKTTSSSNGRLQLTSHTTNTGGIGFGSDVTLFRSAADILKTEDSFHANGEIYALASGGGLKFSASSTTGLIVALQGGGIQFRNSSNANLLTLADAGNVIINSGTLVAGNVGTAIGAAPIVINGTVGDNDSHLIIKKPSQSSLSFLAWDGAAYIGTNTYYENATWIHNAPAGNANSNLFVLNPGVGVMWYASSNSSASWNAAGGVTLWNNSGVWQQPLSNTLTLNTNSGAGLSGSATYNNSGAVTFTVTSNATSANTASTIVLRDGSGFINVTAAQTSSGGANGVRVHTNSGITASNNYMNFFTSQTSGWAFNANGTGADTNTVAVVTSGGNVGIGQTSPSTPLHIYKTGLADNSTNALLTIDGKFAGASVDANDIVGIAFRVENSGGGSQTTTSIGSSYQGSYNGLLLQPSGGNVGIGVKDPLAKLHILSSTPTSVTSVFTNSDIIIDSNTNSYINFRQTADTGVYGGFVWTDNNHGAYIVFRNWQGSAATGGDSLIYGTYQDHIFQAGTGSTINGRSEVMRILQNGRVGIGQTAPSYKLHVAGDIYADGGWFRVSGNQGYYFETHGGGWYMTDSTWLRAYNDKAIITNNEVRATIFKDANDTNYYVDPASTTTSLQIAGAIEQGNNFAHPNVEWSASGSATGMVIIKFPGNTGNYGMIHAVVDIYEYSSNSACTVTVAGHNWNGAWYNISSEVIGYTDKQVRVGVKDSQYCIVIGTSGSSWSYGQVRLRKIQNGSYYNDQMDLGGAYSASITTTESFSNISGDLRNLRTPVNFVANNNVTANGNMYTGGWYRNNANNTGLYNEVTYLHLSSQNANASYLDISTVGSSNSGIRFYTGGHLGTLRGYIVANTSNELMLWNAGGSYSARFTSTVSEIYQDTYVPTLYANIMYDRNDTNYYVNPASTSVLNIIQPTYNNGAIGPSATTAPTNGHNDVAHSVKYLDGYGAAVPNGVEGSWWQGSVAIGNATRGFQLAGGYSVQSLWYRRGADGWQSWVRCLNTSVDPYPSNMNQYVRTSDNVQFNSIGSGIAASGTAGSISLNQSGTRSWTITPTGGNLAFASGDGLGAITYGGSIRATTFFDVSDTTYYVDPNGSSYLNRIAFPPNGTSLSSLYIGNGNVSTTDRLTINFHTDGDLNYYIGKPAGAWTQPLHIKFYTGIRMYSHQSYDYGTSIWNTSSGNILAAFGYGGDNCYMFRSTYAPIIYDYDNTAYYVDPNNSANIAGSVYVGGWFRNYGNQGLYNESYGNHWYATGNDYWNLAGNNASNIGIILRSGGHQGTVRGYVYADSSNNIGFLNNGGSWRLRVVSGDYTLAEGSSIRGQLFYDSNDTNYYVDPASTSNLYRLNVAGYPMRSSTTIDMSNTSLYSTSNYYPVVINIPTGMPTRLRIVNALNSNVPSWATHGSGFTLHVEWTSNGSGWGTIAVNRTIHRYTEGFTNSTICGGITQMTNSSNEVIWLRGGGQYYFESDSNVTPTAYYGTYTNSGQSVTFQSSIINNVWQAASTYMSVGAIKATQFLDVDNEGYYLDPSNTSILNSANFAGTITVGNGASNSYIYMGDSDEGTRAIHNNSNRIGFLNQSSGWGSYCDDSGYWQSEYSIRGPLFYDSNNTAYYFDGASTSVANNVQITTLGVGTAASGTAGEIRATNNITAYYSDERLKTRLGKIEDPIAKVKSLSGFYFEANETAVALGYDKKREVGVSAQEVQAVLPEIIAPAPISDKYMTVRYEKLIPLLIEAIKEQQTQIEQLSNELKSLKNKL